MWRPCVVGTHRSQLWSETSLRATAKWRVPLCFGHTKWSIKTGIKTQFNNSGRILSSFVPTKAFINKKPCVTNHNNFFTHAKLTVLKPPIISWIQRSTGTCFKTTRMSFEKWTIFTYNCMLHKCLLADSSANDMVSLVIRSCLIWYDFHILSRSSV